MHITISAPGKLMLLGEHAVVYGQPCIVTSVDRRLYVTIDTHEGEADIIEMPQVKQSPFVTETLAYFRSKYDVSERLRITTKSDFSHTMGFGSSSAVTVALLKALSVIYDKPMDDRLIFSCGYDIVLKVQGAGSGFDIAAATLGRTLYYVKGGDTLEVIDRPSLPLVIGYTGVKADTTTLIQQVQQLLHESPDRVQSLFRRMGEISLSGREDLLKEDYASLGNKMSENHELLKQIGVSTPLLDRMVDAAVASGAWGAKLSGAGGGDCMVALTDSSHRSAVEAGIRESGGEVISVAMNVPGVTVESV